MYHDVTKSVMDAVGACQAIQEFTKGHTLETYQADYMRRCAVERQFEILGEAFCRIDDADPLFRDNLPEMGDVIGMRNRIIHGYDFVDDVIIWDAVKENIPNLMSKLEAWLAGDRPSYLNEGE
jgi:uncharacterized protein with HEPN domain